MLLATGYGLLVYRYPITCMTEPEFKFVKNAVNFCSNITVSGYISMKEKLLGVLIYEFATRGSCNK